MGSAVRVRRLGSDDWKLFRDIRLAALADAPYAFGSSLAREEGFDEDTWRSRLSPDKGVVVLAFVDGETVGCIGIYTPPDTGEAMLVAAWVRPAVRGGHTANALVTEVVDWSRERGFDKVVLRVADGNDRARKLFLRHGFTPTGEREPLESDPSIGTELLVRTLS